MREQARHLNLWPLLASGRPDCPSVVLVDGALSICLMLNEDGQHRMVEQEDLDRWGCTLAALLPASLERLGSTSLQLDWLSLPDAPGLYGLACGDGMSATRALVLQQILGQWPVGGMLVACPTPGHLLCVPIHSVESIEVLPVLAVAVQKAYQEADRGLSKQIYWLDGGLWHPFEARHEPGNLVLRPPPSFDRMFAHLASMKMVVAAGEA
jgi:hypothetical protein